VIKAKGKEKSASAPSRKPKQKSRLQRSGLRVRGHQASPEVKRAVIRFSKWLRSAFPFPMRVPIYLSPSEKINGRNGIVCSALFFAPYNRTVEPYIRVATGDYPKLKRTVGRNNALAAILHSVAHEVVHYQQWRLTGEVTERGVVRRARRIVIDYSRTVRSP
jgi:hypothetical protein